MNFFRRRSPARELAELSAAARRRASLTNHEKMLAVTRQLRAETGMPPSPVLESGR